MKKAFWSKKVITLAALTLLFVIQFTGCKGSDGAQGAQGINTSSTTTVVSNITTTIYVNTVGTSTPQTYLTTNTPYQPQQSLASYSQVPTGFTPVFTEAVVRHGSRGLSSFDSTLWNMWQQAAADGSLTPLGAQFGADVWEIMKANALLDYGVAGITAPGYGNLTQTGINEEQQIATRLYQRLPSYFSKLAASVNTASPRQILWENSGVNRAVDSGGFFIQSLVTSNPSLGTLDRQDRSSYRISGQ